MRDSNPRSRDQNPLPYRLANPHRTSYYNGRLVSVKLELPLLLILQLGVLLGDADRWIKGVIKGWPVAISTVLLAGRYRHIGVSCRVTSLDDQADIGQRLSIVLGDVIHA